MKKLSYVFYLVLSIVLFSCGGSDTNTTEVKQQPQTYQANYDIQTIDYEGCEYIIYKDRGRASVQMIHKQNCKHCERRQNDR